MILSTLKKVCAAYHQVSTATLTVDGVDLFLIAANNARGNAELLHNFELARVQASLSIDGETGADLSTAVISGGGANYATVTGPLVPDVTGIYQIVGIDAVGQYIYGKQLSNKYMLLSSSEAGGQWQLHDPQANILWERVNSNPVGTYDAITGTTGIATVAITSTSSVWQSLKEVIAVQRTNVDGILVPLDFTRADIAIERDRYELEMSEDYEPYRRYPSDAALLQRGTNGTIIQRGSKLHVYPVNAITSTPLQVTLEAYGLLADYTAANLNDAVATDFFLQYGANFLQWSIICELNFLFRTFVTRQEGNVTSPDKEREKAWRELLLWDTYKVDSNATRSR